MKHHIMIALGILMATIFCFRMANAINGPGGLSFGFFELYLAGGIGLASWLIFAGLSERQRARRDQDDHDA